MSGATVTVQDLTITKGNIGPYEGGGISNSGALTLQHSAVSGNMAKAGGGLFNFGTLTLQHSTVSGNTAQNSGGIANYGTLALQHSTVSNNIVVESGGGGIMNVASGVVTVGAGSSVNRNNAPMTGGGILNVDGTVTLESGSSVAINRGYGIRNTNGGTVTVNGIVTNNTPANCTGEGVSPPESCANIS